MNSKKTKQSNVPRLPSLYAKTLIKTESDYRREMRRKLDQLQRDNQETIRRRAANDHLFAHEHLSKRYHWFHLDKTYRESCRSMWNKPNGENNRTSHVFLPNIYTNNTTTKNPYESYSKENSNITDKKIQQKFLNVQPVMLEIIKAPHSSQALRIKQQLESRKQSAQRKHVQLQTHAIDDRRYRDLVYSLEDIF